MLSAVLQFLRKGFEPKHLVSTSCLIVLLFTKTFDQVGSWISILAAIFLGAAVMSSVHHAEIIAHKIGEGLGTLVLALCVTFIEVGLIISMMTQAAGADGSYLARDTVFAAVMIITNGMVGLCLILGGLKYKEQEFQVHGSQSLLVVLITLSMLVFILPNYTTTTAGPTYNATQMIFTGTICVLLYLLFIFFQTKTHKAYFEPTVGTTKVEAPAEEAHEVSSGDAWLSFISLVVSLVSVIGLAKIISPMIEQGITFLGAPKATIGLLIAVIVLLPETWAAINAARANRLQTSLNLALGSGIASIALTIPAVIIFSLSENRGLALGLDPKNTVFLVTTFLVGVLTLGSGKSTLLQGAVHIVILLTYFAMSFVP